MQQRNALRQLVLMVCACFLTSASAFATVRATVDRPTVDLNESFMLEIIVDSSVD